MPSKNLNGLLDKLKHENNEKNSGFNVLEEENKGLAKEDSLALIAEFVKDVKKKFENKDDQLEILRDASKTLEFYINEIVNTSSTTSSTTSSSTSTKPRSFDTPADSSSSDDEFNLDKF